MLKVSCELRIYDTLPSITERNIQIKTDGKHSDFVILTIQGNDYKIVGRDLINSVCNAMNV